MSLASLLARLANALDDVGVPWMLSGSLASAFHGTPRSTQDIDIIVVLTLRDLPALLAAFPEDDYYLSESAAREAVRVHGQFNVIDLQTGWKVDLILRKQRPFSLAEFDRRVEREVLGVRVPVCSPEDSILSKLEWASKMGGSDRQLRDVTGIWELQRGALDLDYLGRWAGDLGVLGLWRAVFEAD